VDGTCYGLDLGDILVQLVVESCDRYGAGHRQTGWNSARTMLIMEMVTQKHSAGQLLSLQSLELLILNFQSVSEC